MIKLQNPNIPAPLEAIEIDKAIYLLQMLLDTNLIWLTNSYGRSYRHIDKSGNRLYFPEVYIGGDANDYYRVTPDNDKKGTCFFVVDKEENYDFEINQSNYLRWNVGIIFWVNLKLINKQLLKNEIFTQNLIRDVRYVLTRKSGGLPFGLKIKTVEREFRDIYKEFTLNENEDYLRSPFSGFRFNLEIVMRENCNIVLDTVQALLQNLSKAEKLAILSSLDFSDTETFNALTQQQKIDLGI